MDSKSVLAIFFIGFLVSAFEDGLIETEIDSSCGWDLQENIYCSANATKEEAIGANKLEQSSPRVIPLSWSPRAFLYEGFLTDEECDHIVNLGKSKLEASEVVDNDSGNNILSEVRTSFGMFLDKGQDEVIRKIEDRISTWTFLPRENAESIQVLRYAIGQKYSPHYDYFHDEAHKAIGGDRYATVLMYLTTVAKGGETVFPNVEDKTIKDDSWSECGKKGLAVKPRKGDALLFFSLHPDGTHDEYSLHEACPVIEGEKWSAPAWIHVQTYSNK